MYPLADEHAGGPRAGSGSRSGLDSPGIGASAPRAQYRDVLARVHDRGMGGRADDCAAGILSLLRPVLERSGVVLELGCGGGRLTRHLVTAGHRVIATDASEAMLSLAREAVPSATVERLILPDDPLPDVDAIVAVGEVFNHLDSESQVHCALRASAAALRPGGVLAVELCDLTRGQHLNHGPTRTRVGGDWAIIVRYETPAPDVIVRHIVTFVRDRDGSWRRDDERHENVLIDTSSIPGFLERHQLDAEVRPTFGDESPAEGLVALVGTKRPTNR